MKKVRVMFSRVYDVVLEVPDDADDDRIEELARDIVIEGGSELSVGGLEFDGIESNPEE